MLNHSVFVSCISLATEHTPAFNNSSFLNYLKLFPHLTSSRSLTGHWFKFVTFLVSSGHQNIRTA